MTEMKRFFLAVFAVAAALSLASCSEELIDGNGNGSNRPKSGDPNTLIFSLVQNGPQTRSEVASAPKLEAMIPMGDPVEGYNFYLEETVEEADAVAYSPATRGTPVYTENFADMFDQFYGVVYDQAGTTVVAPDAGFSNAGSYWQRKFDTNPYDNHNVLYFFLRAPGTTAGMSNLTYRVANNGRAITEFDYTVPLNAVDQNEILITGRSVTKDQAQEAIPILFHHALTGIKFASDNDNSTDAVKTYITKVEFPNALFRSAHFRITSSWENGKWQDDPDIHSSSDTGVSNVSSGQQLNSSEVFTLNLTESDMVDFAKGGSFTSKGEYPDSFAEAGNNKNLNDGDASKTFWLIPQRMNNNIVMDVTFHVISAGKDSGPITRRIQIGRILTNSVTWRAGQIRTFTLKADLMDVDITDKVNGFEKTDVEITNTGNIDSFIRAHITANWFGNAGNTYGVAVGYPSETSTTFIEAWKMSKSGTTYTDNFGGSFENLPGAKWVQGPDGFFYYTEAVPAGTKIPSPLFTKYSVSGTNIPPTIWYQDTKNVRHQYTGVELVMEIPVQAIEAEEGKNYKQAWEAVGVTGLPDPE